MPFDLRNKKVLLTDDSTIMRMVISMHLKRFTGVQITEAVNGREALEMLRQQPFDLLLTDVNMPEMTGTDLVRHVRTELNSKIPIVIITTKGEIADRDLGMSLGADRYLTKPVDPKSLIMTVLDLLGALVRHPAAQS